MANKTIVLKNVRIAFIDNLFTPGQFQGEGKLRYSFKVPIEPESANDKLIDEAMVEVAIAKWEKAGAAVLADLVKRERTAYIKKEYCNQKSKEPHNGFVGTYYLSPTADPSKGQRVLTVDKKLNSVTQADGVIYAGCRCDVKVSMWAQDDRKWGQRINCQALVVQFRADDDAFGGGAPATVAGMEALEDVGESIDDLMG